MKIAQFLPKYAAFSVINEYSTFCLRNVIYYRILEEQHRDNLIGDKKENIVEFRENRRNYELIATTLLSCWTIIENDEIHEEDWNVFNDRTDGIAIISDTKSVESCIKENTKYFLDSKVWHLEHQKVNYYDGIRHPKEFDTANAPFWKRDHYKHQQEYRFALLSSSKRSNIETIIFYVLEPQKYIQKVCFGPDMELSDKKKLRSQAIAGELFGTIPDF